MNHLHSSAFVLALASLLAACGGGAPTAGSAAPQAAVTAAPEASASSAAAPAQTAQPAAAPAALGKDAACALAPNEEVAAAFGLSGLKAAPSAFSGQVKDGIATADCYFVTSDSKSVLGLTYSVYSSSAAVNADFIAAAYSGEKIADFEGASYADGIGFVLVQNGRLLVMSAPGMSSDEARPILEKLARAAARRMQ